MTRNNQSYWYGFEAIGTVRQLMGSQGQVVDAYAFDAWGNEITNPQSQVSNPFKYVGKHGYYLDTESALMLLGVRYYSATNGLFLSRDLIEGYGYSYAADNPIRWTDLTGLQHGDDKDKDCKKDKDPCDGKFEMCRETCKNKGGIKQYKCKSENGVITEYICVCQQDQQVTPPPRPKPRKPCDPENIKTIEGLALCIKCVHDCIQNYQKDLERGLCIILECGLPFQVKIPIISPTPSPGSMPSDCIPIIIQKRGDYYDN